MQNCQIAFTAPCVAELVERTIPTPGSGEVLVKLHVSTISSGTERANVSGDANINIMSTDPVAHFPRYSGYSSAGVVVEVGEGVKSVVPGDRVALEVSDKTFRGTYRVQEAVTTCGEDGILCRLTLWAEE